MAGAAQSAAAPVQVVIVQRRFAACSLRPAAPARPGASGGAQACRSLELHPLERPHLLSAASLRALHEAGACAGSGALPCARRLLRGQGASAALLLRRLRSGVPSPGPGAALSVHGAAWAPSLAAATRRRFQVEPGWQGVGRPSSASRFWLAAMRTSRSASYAFCVCIRASGHCMQGVRSCHPTLCLRDLPLYLQPDSTASSNWPATLRPFRFGKSFSARAAS